MFDGNSRNVRGKLKFHDEFAVHLLSLNYLRANLEARFKSSKCTEVLQLFCEKKLALINNRLLLYNFLHE